MLSTKSKILIKRILLISVGLFILSMIIVASFFIFIFIISLVATIIVVRAIAKKIDSRKNNFDYNGKTFSDIEYTEINENNKD